MRILQNISIYPTYAKKFLSKPRVVLAAGYEGVMLEFLDDGFDCAHLLKGGEAAGGKVFLSVGNLLLSQQLWAKEHGMPRDADAADILLAQIEHHRAEVFYNQDVVRFDDHFLKRLPGCVKHTVAWSAAPTPHMRFVDYDLVVNNFPGILERYRRHGCRTGYFFPSFDSLMAPPAGQERDLDVVFVGGYSRHHLRRNRVLDAVASLAPKYNIRFHLDLGRLNRLAEHPLCRFTGLLQKHARTPAIRAVGGPPLFGRELFRVFQRAKIVLNAAVDMAGRERGNMRCFETLGCGAMMLSDEGEYPDEMVSEKNLATYQSGEDACAQISRLLADETTRRSIADAGHAMIVERYSKERQWQAFQNLPL